MEIGKQKNMNKTILKWKTLQLNLVLFEKRHRQEIEEYEQQEKTKKITKYLKLLDPEKTLIWCRNGEICHIATPCKKLSGFAEAKVGSETYTLSGCGQIVLVQRKLCPFKPNWCDITEGCIKCASFVVTEKNEDWNTAKQLKQWDEEADEEG